VTAVRARERFSQLVRCPRPGCGKFTSFSFNEDLGKQVHAMRRHHPEEQTAVLIYPCCGFRRVLDREDLNAVRKAWPKP